MNAMKIERAYLVGNSMGCQITVEAALQRLAQVDRLILIEPNSYPAARSVAEQFRRFLSGGASERPSLNQHLLKDLIHARKPIRRQAAKASGAHDSGARNAWAS
jgi:pimeloyl-ACP methyl ester carboxylesterase